MKVKDLRRLLDEAKDEEMEVVVSGDDHTFNQVGARIVYASMASRPELGMYEFWSDDTIPPGCKKVRVLWVG